MLIMKFGGTSVGSPERMQKLVSLIHDDRPKIVVLSAMSGTTNSLVDIASALYKDDSVDANQKIDVLESFYKQVVDELYFKTEFKQKGIELIQSHFSYIRSFTLDMFTIYEEKAILAQGELISTALFQLYLEEQSIPSVLLHALDFMRLNTDEEPDYALIQKLLNEKLKSIPSKKIIITQGYICRNSFGEIDNLKRGGSDFTATIIGAMLHSPEIQIWTDIDGMHNNDPRVVEKTFPITELSYDEAAELAYFGARILHPTCVLPAQKMHVPIRLLNTMKPDTIGTIIHGIQSSRPVTAIAAKDGITVINIRSGRMLQAYGFLRNIFEVFESYRTPIDMITTSEVAVSLTIDNDSALSEIIAELQNLGTVEFEQLQTIVCVVGDFSRDKQDEAFRVLDALKDIPLRMISYGGSEHNISVLIQSNQKAAAMQALNNALFNNEKV
jgi:aspartate kinase